MDRPISLFRRLFRRRKSQASGAAQQPLQQQQALDTPPSERQAGEAVQPVTDAQQVMQKPTQAHTRATSSALRIDLRNDTASQTVYAYITGQALDRGNALFLLQADGVTPYYPASPSVPQQRLAANCAIPLGHPGTTVTVHIPHIAGGRIWFSVDAPLTFLLNPGPALVEPSVTNLSDPNINTDWVFAEFTFNSDQLYANISYVDFVSIPISLTLQTANSGTQRVLGMPVNGVQKVADGLRAQQAVDHQGWDQLIVNSPGTNNPLRVLSPNLGRVLKPNLLTNYFATYVNEVFARYAAQVLSVDTQSGYGVVTSRPMSASNARSLMVGTQTFAEPNTGDIFSCSTGPFATGSNAERNAIIPRLAAAFNRSTLLNGNFIPAPSNQYYKNAITNHYSRIVHGVNLDGRGYAFPYDDVQQTGDSDQSGKVEAGDPVLFTVAVGGAQAGK